MWLLIVCYLDYTSECSPVVVSEPVPYQMCQTNAKKILRWNESTKVWAYCQKAPAGEET